MRFSTYFLCLLLCVPAGADYPLTITDAGYWLTFVSEDGVPSYRKVTEVKDLREGTDVPPVDVPPDTPTDTPKTPDFDSVLVADSTVWAKEIGDPLTSQAISAVYAHVGGAYEDGLVSPEAIWPVLKEATDKAIAISDSGKDWKSFRTKLSDAITLGQQQGSLSSKETTSRLIRSVRQGLDLSADGSIALSIDKFIRIAAATNGVIDAN